MSIQYKIIDQDIVEFEVDPSHDSDYDSCYCTSLSRDELLFLLSKLDAPVTES